MQKKSEKNNEPNLKKTLNRQTNRRTNSGTNKQMNWQRQNYRTYPAKKLADCHTWQLPSKKGSFDLFLFLILIFMQKNKKDPVPYSGDMVDERILQTD